MSVIERFLETIELIGITPYEIEIKLGVKSAQSKISQMKETRTKGGKEKTISSDILSAVCMAKPEINLEYILTGRGEPIKLENKTNITGDNNQAFTGTSGIAIGVGRDNSGKINVSNGKMPNDTDNEVAKINFTTGVPYYNVDFIGGFDLVMNDQTIIPEYLIDFRKYNDADCWCNVTGHSMEPEIYHGDIIALKEVKDMSFLPIGEVYAIVTTNNMRTIKRLGVGDDNEHYNLIPTNKSTEYGIQPIPKNMIMKIFQILGCMKRL